MTNLFKKAEEKRSIADDLLFTGKQKSKQVEDKKENKKENKKETSDAAKIVIKKKTKNRTIRRQTYHLEEEVIKNIEYNSNEAGMGKSEFVNMILKTAFERLKIQ